MAGLGCFIKDTEVISDIQDIMQTLAASNIEDGKQFTVRMAYKFFTDNGLEIDLESIGAIYENQFDLNDGNFNSQVELDDIVGKSFTDTLNNLVEMQPKIINEKTGELSVGKKIAKTIAGIFRSANVTDIKTQTTMKLFEKMLDKAARRIVNRSSLPQKQKLPQRSMEEMLTDAFELDSKGIRTITGELNSTQQVWDEFQKEVDKYRQGLIDNDADAVTIEQFDIYTDAIINKGYDLLLSEKENKKIIKDTLIDGGAFREVTKNGVKEKVLDWKALTNSVGDMNYLREKVTEILSDKGYTDEQIERINRSLENEYVNLRASIIKKQQDKLDKAEAAQRAKPAKELSRRNKVRQHQQSVDSKRLAELYTYGLFDATPDSYENILNSVMGMSEIDQKTFNKLKVLGKSLQTLYAAKLGDNQLSDIMLKSALNSVNEQIGHILRDNSNSNSLLLRVARTIQSIMDASLRFILTGLKNMAWQNPLSGKTAKITASIQEGLKGNSTGELNKQNRELVKAVFKDMVLSGGLHYGDVNTTFVNRGRLDELVNNLSSNKMYHAIVGTIIGRVGLDGMDSRFKASISEKYLIHNLLKILTNPTNPNKMSKADALAYVSEHLTGVKYAEAENLARSLITQINTDAGQPILNTSQSFVTRLANDIVKAQLMSGGIVTEDQLNAAYNAAYRASGRDLGHVPNNMLSVWINSGSNIIQKKIDDSVKRRNYEMASAWTLAQIFMRNFANPFVGGSTNWIVLKLEKSGVGLVTGLLNKVINSKANIDLSSDAGLKHLESDLYEQMKANNKMYRGAVGAASSLVVYSVIWAGLKAAFGGGGDDDERRKKRFQDWRKANRWLSKYTDELTPEWMLAEVAFRNDDALKYLTNYYNMNDQYSAVGLAKDAVGLFNKGDVSEGYGKLGQAVGTKINLPVPGWRMVRDVIQLKDGFMGKNPSYDYNKSRSFQQGLMKNGFLETVGVKVNPAYTLDALPGVSGKTLEHLEELGIKNIQDLRKQRFSLETLKFKDKAGKKIPIFDKKDREAIIPILKAVENE